MGAALVDAYARGAQGCDTLLSLKNCSASKLVNDAQGCSLALGSENSVISLSLFETLIAGRKANHSQVVLMESCASCLAGLSMRQTSDEFYRYRPFQKDTLRAFQLLSQKNTDETAKSSVPSSVPLVCMIAAGLTFLDDLDLVKRHANSIIELTHTDPVYGPQELHLL